MMISRTFKFPTKEDLIKFIKKVDPLVRVWNMDDLTVRITVDDKADAQAMEVGAQAHQGEPIGEWEEKWK